jgi:hypothetical protein
MTTINLATNLPSDVNTLEKLSLHNLLCLEALYGNLTFPANLNDRQAFLITSQIAKAYDGKHYQQFVVHFELDSAELLSGATDKKPWHLAKEWGNIAYPSTFAENNP